MVDSGSGNYEGLPGSYGVVGSAAGNLPDIGTHEYVVGGIGQFVGEVVNFVAQDVAQAYSVGIHRLVGIVIDLEISVFEVACRG